MKHIVILALFVSILSIFVGCENLSGRPFVTEWQWKGGQNVTVPIYGNNVKGVVRAQNHSDVNLKINISAGKECSFIVPYDDTYEMTIYPDGVLYFQMFDVLHEEKYKNWTQEIYDSFLEFAASLRKIKQWGDVKWISMVGAFCQCKNLEIDPDAGNPNLENCTSCDGMFAGCESFNSPVDSWDVSHVTSMFGMFEQCKRFNQPLNSWDVSSVENMCSMFTHCLSFNQPLDQWNVSHVKKMSTMFAACHRFNQPIGAWDVSRCEDMLFMFRDCYSFNQPLNSWNVYNVKNMKCTFAGCRAFNQPLDLWDLSNAENIDFDDMESFNQDLSSWRMPKCTYLSLQNTGMSKENLSKSLISWAQNHNGLGMIVRVPEYNLTEEALDTLNYLREKGIWNAVNVP